MSPEVIVGVAVGSVALLGVVGRLLWATHKGLNLFEHLIERVSALEKTLTNGIRTDIKRAAERAEEARLLAAKAATLAATSQQLATEGRQTIERSVNSLRAEVNALTNVALEDHTHIWRTLSEAGLDRRDPDER